MLRILLVEDSEDSRLLAQVLLKKLPLQLEFAEHGQRALERLSVETFDLVLMDIQMPGIDGFETVREFRKRKNGGPRTPVVALTGFAQDEILARLNEAGFDGYLAKPFKKSELVAIIERFFPGAGLIAL